MIKNWNSNITYRKNDIVKYGGKIYFSLTENNINNNPPVIPFDLNQDSSNFSFWSSEDFFVWSPSNSSRINQNMKPQEFQLGDFYNKQLSKAVKYSLNAFNLVFQNINDQECMAICEFIKNKCGDPFIWKTPFFEKNLYFSCLSMNHVIDFNKTNSIQLIFEENTNFKPIFTNFLVEQNSYPSEYIEAGGE